MTRRIWASASQRSVICVSMGWTDMGSQFSSASVKRVEMSPGIIVCTRTLPRRLEGEAVGEVDDDYLAIKKIIRCW